MAGRHVMRTWPRPRRLLSLTAAATFVSIAWLLAPTSHGSVDARAASGLPTLTIAMNGKSIKVGGVLQSGAVNVKSTVADEVQGDPALVLLRHGASIRKALEAVNSHNGDLDYLDPYGSIVLDAAAARGTSEVQTFLAPGRYAALDGSSGAAIPPYSEFTITRAAHPAKLPRPEGIITTIDFGFRGADTLHDGELVRFQNRGFLLHMGIALPVSNATDAATVTAFVRAGENLEARSLLAGAVVDFDIGLSHGDMQQEVIRARPGIYVLVCLMTTQDGRDMAQLGMERTIRITRQ